MDRYGRNDGHEQNYVKRDSKMAQDPHHDNLGDLAFGKTISAKNGAESFLVEDR